MHRDKSATRSLNEVSALHESTFCMKKHSLAGVCTRLDSGENIPHSVV
jgi:hypothetical protein